MSPKIKRKSPPVSAAGGSAGSRVPTADEETAAPTATSFQRGARLRDFTAITKALADETRVRVLMTLQRGELCVCQIVELAGLATSTVSKHMSILKQARLVESRKVGRWMYYRLADDSAPPAVQHAIAWVTQSLAKDPQVLRDRQRVAKICNSDPDELCGG
ncbi:MAG: ArsR/SmtB family transcription factor [Planctomycetota bacterium]